MSGSNRRNTFTFSPAGLAMAAIILFFAALFSAIALNRHAAFLSNGFDLGNVNQAVWNTAQGRPLAFTNMAPVENRLALHVEPILLFLAPFYRLGVDGPRFLLVIQAIVVALGAWPLYLIARPQIGKAGAVIIGGCYLLYPALEAAALYDFHAVTLAPTFLLFAFYFLEQITNGEWQMANGEWQIANGKWQMTSDKWQLTNDQWPLAISILLALCCKEDMGLVVAMLGLYAGWRSKRWKPALILGGAGLLWTLIAVLAVQPLFAPGGNVQAGRYGWLAQALTDPALLWAHLAQINLPGYLWGMVAPVAGLALAAPPALLPVLPSLAVNLLSDHGLQWRLEEFHYAAPMAPFVFIAAVNGLKRLAEFLGRRGVSARYAQAILLLALATASLTYHYYRGFTPAAKPFAWQTVTAHHHLGERLAAAIPVEIPLFAPLTLNPHVSSRPVLHQDFDDLAPADWLFLDVSTLSNQNGVQAYIQTDLLRRYQTVLATDGYLLLRPPNSPFPAEAVQVTTDLPFEQFMFPRATAQYSVSVVFGEKIELTGYNIELNRAAEPRLITYWKALSPLAAETAPVLYLLDEAGNAQGATEARLSAPQLLWQPADGWAVGRTMAVDFPAPAWETRDQSAYRLAIGVTAAADPWETSARLQPAVQASVYATAFAADGSLVELARFKRVAGMVYGGPVLRQQRAPVLERRAETDFGGQIRLAGYNVPSVRAGQVEVELLWQGITPERGNLIRFAHCVGPDGGLRGQVDSWPVNGSYPVALWAAGEFVPETVRLPLGGQTPGAGQYTLHLGWYNPATGQRLITATGADHLEIPFTPAK